MSQILRTGLVKVAKNIMSTIRLKDGVDMPMFGLGTYSSIANESAEDAVCHAIQHGYRLIDTAQSYKNEEDVGKGLKRSGRSDVFLVSKVMLANHGYEKTTASVKESLKKFDLSCIDLFLIHTPEGGSNVETFRALLDLKHSGLIRSAGVSNFGPVHLEGLKKAGLPLPSVNQIELHPYKTNEHVVAYCRQNDIALMGYSPLIRARKDDDLDLQAIAKKYGKTRAQILLRWSVQNGYITIPKSANPERIIENANVFDFSLTEEDYERLSGRPDFACGRYGTTSPWQE